MERTYILKMRNCKPIRFMCEPCDMQNMFYNMSKRNIESVKVYNPLNNMDEDITKYIL